MPIRFATTPPEDALAALGTDAEGLEPAEAALRLVEHGPNALPAPRRRHAALRLLAHAGRLPALLLSCAAALAAAAGAAELAGTIAAAVAGNALFALWQERRAERALASVEALVPLRARVVRGGVEREVDAAAVVPGDLLVLAEGGRVAADARVVESAHLRLELSPVTGERGPVERDAGSADPGVSLASARCVAPAGAMVAAGRGRAVAFATGASTELSRRARLAAPERAPPSGLEAQVARGLRALSAVALGGGVVVFAILHARGSPAPVSLLAAVGLVVASAPEGLLAMLGVTLAANAVRMARRDVAVSRLSAVERLGAVDVVCTGPTGVLTDNALAARTAWLPGAGEVALGAAGQRGPARALLAAAALASDGRMGALGADPLERALLAAAARSGLDLAAFRAPCGRRAEVPVDPRRPLVTVLVRAAPPLAAVAGAPWAVVAKGAPSAVVGRCVAAAHGGSVRALDAPERARVLAAHDALAERGLRVVAVALRGVGPELAALPPDRLEEGLTLLGLVALEDPVRPGARAALAACRGAGIAVTLVTGDRGLTARAVARSAGASRRGARAVDGTELDALDDPRLDALLSSGADLVFAPASPEQKLRLVRGYQRLGKVVAVTGEGVDDAPALHAADVAIATAAGGTDVARAAADVVLLDDDLATVAAAVEEGRATFANVRKLLAYVLTSSVPQMTPFFALALLGLPPALGIPQLLAIRLGTDVLPALALGAGPAEPDAMAGPPRRAGARALGWALLGRAWLWLGLLEAAACLGAYLFTWRAAGHDLTALRAVTPALLAGAAPAAVGAIQRRATSAALAAIVGCQVGNALACRSERRPVLARGFRLPRALGVAIAAAIALVVAVVELAPLQRLFGTAALPGSTWAALALCAPGLVLLDDLRKRAVALAGRVGAAAASRRPPGPSGERRGGTAR